MTDVDFTFLARQNERVLTEIAGLRDDMRVLSAIVMKLDHTRERHEGLLTDMLQELRAIHGQITRMNDRIRTLEETGR